jgi:hypothetical protein
MLKTGWNKDIKSVVREFTVFTQEDAFDAFEGAAEDVAKGIIKDTPIGLTPAEGGTAGRLRYNWQIDRNINQREFKTRDTGNRSNYVERQVRGRLRGEKRNGLYTGGVPLYMFNNLPYAPVVEYGGYPFPVKKGTYNKATGMYEIRSNNGYSKQAPAGMMAINAAQFGAHFKKRFSIL